MTALSANKVIESVNAGEVKAFQMAASTTIYAGGMVMLNSSGLLVPAAVGAGNFGVVGMATESITSDASTASWLEVQEGVFKVVGATLAQADVGELVWATDDATIDDVPALNGPVAGYLVEYVGASSAWVYMSWKLNKQKSYVVLHFSVDAADIADGDIVTTMVPGVVGLITKFSKTIEKAVTTGAKGTTLNLEIGTTNVTGGSLVCTGAESLGAYQAATAITAANVLAAASTLSVEAASTTTYIEGRFGLDITIQVF